MNVNNILSSRLMVGAAIVGIVGAAGVFIYEQIYAEKRRSMLVSEVARLDKQVASMRSELEAIRELQKETQLRRLKQRKAAKERREKITQKTVTPSGDLADGPDQSYASDSEYFTDYQSVLGTDGEMDSEEFYDVHTDDDDDDDTLRESISNGQILNSNEQIKAMKPDKDVDLISSPKNST